MLTEQEFKDGIKIAVILPVLENRTGYEV